MRGRLRFSVTGSTVLLQNETKGHNGRTLQIDLRDGTAALIRSDPLPEDSPVVLGLIGLLKLHGGAVLALISKAKQVCAFPHPVFKVTGTQLVTHENVKKTFRDLRLAALLQEALDHRTYGQHLYFR